MADRIPTEVLPTQTIEQIRSLVDKHGIEAAAQLLGIDSRTLCKAAAQFRVHRLTCSAVGARIAVLNSRKI